VARLTNAAGRSSSPAPRGDRRFGQERGMLRKILAVDDSALIHQMYKLFLSRYKNCKLVSAMNGVALEKLGQEEGIDLILLDINMPVMNGLEFLQRVQKEAAYKDIPVIIISTEGKEEDTIRGLKMGARGYVKKPFQASELHGLIEKITSP
jgi:two-component system chemotaxis response regulator CheY